MNKYQIEVNNREIIAKNPNTKIEILEKLAFDAEPKVKKAVASRSDLPIDLIEKMAADRQIIAKKFLLRNKSFSESLLTTLSQSSDPKVLQMVALHPNTPTSLLKKLATVSSAKSFVAQNSNVTLEILGELVIIENKEVHLALAKSCKSSLEILHILIQKKLNIKIIFAVINNSQANLNIRHKAIQILSEDRRNSIIKYVSQHHDTPEKILINWSQSAKFKKYHPLIAENPNTPKFVLEKMAKYPNKDMRLEIRIGVAKNRNTPGYILDFLFEEYKDRSKYIYREINLAIARNPNTRIYIRKKISII